MILSLLLNIIEINKLLYKTKKANAVLLSMILVALVVIIGVIVIAKSQGIFQGNQEVASSGFKKIIGVSND